VHRAGSANASVSASEIAALRSKYERIRALRALHAQSQRDPDFIEPDPRSEMAALAVAFPGALRELDDLPMAQIDERIAALARAEQDPAHVARWMIAQAVFHRLARGALVAKRWLAARSEPEGRSAVDDVVRAAFEHAVEATPSGRGREDARLWIDELDRVARPPRGRVMDLVHARVGATLGVTAAEARELVFGRDRRSRRG
jgi:hypothetical protein